MAIRLPQGFRITSRQPIDSRVVLTKEEMLSIDETSFPENYFVVCSDDSQMYVFNKQNEFKDDIGKFRLSVDSEMTERKANDIQLQTNIDILDSSLATIAKTGNVNNLIQDEEDILILDCNP